MRRLFVYIILSLFLIPLGFSQAPYLISYEKANEISADSLARLMKRNKVPNYIIPTTYGVDIYDVRYKTCWYDTVCIKVSGLVFVPQNFDGQAPVMNFHHGTQIKKKRHTRITGLRAVCVGFATDGYVVCMPDYVGLGHGDGQHLYNHTLSEAYAAIDMIRATRELCEKLSVKLDGEVYISGYSQGGHGALATHRLIEEKHQDEINLKGSSPMSGPYDLAGVQAEVMFEEYSHPGYLPYLLLSYNEAYGFFDDFWSIFKSPYDTLLPPLFDGTHTMGDINKVLPAVPADAVRPELVHQFESNPQFPFLEKLKENSLVNWKPEGPVQLCYCKGDEQVDYRNSIVAAKKMRELGAKKVRLRMSGRTLNHYQCALYASVYTKWFFDSIRKGSKKGRKGPAMKRFVMSLSKISVNKKNRKKRRKQKKQ